MRGWLWEPCGIRVYLFMSGGFIWKEKLFMTSLWVVHEQAMSEWFLERQIAGITLETGIAFFGHMAKPLGNENKGFMSKPWKDYERLMSGSTRDSQGTPNNLQLSKNISLLCKPISFRWILRKQSTQTRPDSCKRTCEAHRLWVVYEKFMSGSWVDNEWIIQHTV